SGRKLKGEWTLNRMQSEDEKTRWLIVKSGGNAKSIPKEKEGVSAITGKTMEQIAGKGAAVWRSDRGESGKRPTPDKNKGKHRTPNTERRTPNDTRRYNVGGALAPRRSRHKGLSQARFVQPMKATAVSQLPEGEDWIYEVKWDGYRALALKEGENVRLMSLKEKNLTSDFPSVVAE